MNAFKLVFSAKACFKVVVRGVKIGEAIVFLVDPYLTQLNTCMVVITVYSYNPKGSLVKSYTLLKVIIIMGQAIKLTDEGR